MFSYVSGIAGEKRHSTKESSKIWTKRTQSSLTMPSSEKLSKVTLFFFKKISLEKSNQATTWMVMARFQQENLKLS